MSKITDCAFCDGKVQITIDKRSVTLHAEEIEFQEYFYKCDKCREEFVDDALADINLKQIYDEYKRRYPDWQHPYEK